MGATLVISPESAVMLDAISPGGERRAMRRGTVRWDEVLALAAWHRMEPLLYRLLRARDEAPSDVVRALQRAYVSNAARNLLLRSSLDRALAVLAAAGVPAILLKGAALVDSIYTDPALREMTDLDVLVPHEALDDANTALAAIGYGPALPIESVQDTAAWMRVHHHHDPPLVDGKQIAAIELHHHLLSPDRRGGLDVADVWRRARPVPGASYQLPAANDLLLHACLHFMFNRSARSRGSLAQLADIAWILGRSEIEWPEFTSTVDACRLRADVFLALFAAHELGVPVPEGALEAIRPNGFDPDLGRRLVTLRVLRAGPHFPVRSLRWILAPGRECLVRGWDADPERPGSLASGYARRALAILPLARAALGEPRTVVADYLLNRQIAALASRSSSSPTVTQSLQP